MRSSTIITVQDIDSLPYSQYYAKDFSSGPVVKTLPSNAGGVDSIPGQGVKIPHASWPKNQSKK